MLAGVIFSPKIEGDSKPPCQQSKLSKIQLQGKKFLVFNKAVSELKGYWKDAKFGSYPVVIDTVKCGEDELRWNDYDRVKTFFKSPLRDLHNFRDLSNECKKMFLHVDLHSKELVFMRYSDRSCCSDWRFEKLRDHLSMFQFKLPAPVFGTFCNGHFDIFLQCIEKRGVGQNYGDEEQPTAVAKDLGKCVFCPNYSFSSKTEKERHIGMFHRRVKTSYKEPTFKCSTCSSTFRSPATLNRHKLKEGHNKREIATASTPKKKR